VEHQPTAYRRHRHPVDRCRTPPGRGIATPLARESFECVLVSPLQRTRETSSLAGVGAEAIVEPDLSEWNYGEYEGLTPQQIHDMRPGWMIFRDGCPGGESPEQIGVRIDRVIERARRCDGNVALFSHGHLLHGHLLRALAARWIGLSATGGQHFLLGTGALCVLGYYRDEPAVKIWNGPIAT
jgi:broad specificity phosphatase PhoE